MYTFLYAFYREFIIFSENLGTAKQKYKTRTNRFTMYIE